MKMNFKIYAKVKNGKIVEIYDAKKTAVCAGYVPHTAKYVADQSDVPDFCDTLRNRVAKRQKTTPAVFKQLGLI
jgi:hypothetical protein